MTSVSLDQPSAYSSLDPDDMYRRVGDLAMQMRASWDVAGNIELPGSYRSIRNIVIAGMGGSAIGGSLIEGYGTGEVPVPVEVWRYYGAPAYVDEHTLFIAVSYSGNTEETLSGLNAAHERQAKLLAISTGGKVKSMSEEWGIPLLTFDYDAPPRATLGYLFTPLVRIFERLDLLGSQREAFEESLRVVEDCSAAWRGEQPSSDNLAKQLATQTRERGVVVYGAGYLAAVARRWKTQFNENAKNWAWYEEFPELNHNAVVGYEYPKRMIDALQVMMLDGSHLPQRVRLRMDVTGQLMDKFNVPYRRIEGRGTSRLAQIFSLIALGDYVTYYLALLNGADPTEIEPINFLKDALSKA